MKNLINFEEFLNEEAAKFSDLSKLLNINKDNIDVFDMIKDYQDDTFKDDTNLLDIIVLPNVNKIVNIKWNHKDLHDIKKRIKERTNCKNISEFNEIFQECLNLLFSKYFYDIEEDINEYTIHLEQRNINILVRFDYNDMFNEKFTIYVITIINSTVSNIKNINIEEL